MTNRTRITRALASLAIASVGSSMTAQSKYWPDRPPMSISFQGAERPSWYSTTFFCNAVYEWRSDQYGAMGRVMESADVRIGIRSDRRDYEVEAPFTTSVFSGSPKAGTQFTTPPCGGRETADFDIIGKLYGYGLARVGPAVFVRKLGR
jgi:hypothetical protein